MTLAERYRHAIRHDDPLAEASSGVAWLVAASQPFYPLYVWWIVGDAFWPTLFTFLSTPLFVAVPAVARRNSPAGRALLTFAGIANTAMSAALIGAQTGVLLFLFPCLMIAILQFRRDERRWTYGLVALVLAAFWFLYPGPFPPLAGFTADEISGLVTLHAFSAGGLTLFAGLSLGEAGAKK